MESQHTLEWSEASGGLSEGILGVIHPGKELAPAVLVLVAVGPQVSPNFLDLALSMAIVLGMVARG